MIKIDFNNIGLQKAELLQLEDQEKIEVLKLAYRKGIDVWFETAKVFLDAGVKQGGLTSETVEKLFEMLILKSNDIFGDEIK